MRGGRRIQETDPMILGDVCGSWFQLFMPSEFLLQFYGVQVSFLSLNFFIYLSFKLV